LDASSKHGYKIGFDSVGATKGYLRYNVDTNSAGSATWGHVFSGGPMSGVTNWMFIGGGRVGIGNVAPTVELDVTGTIKASAGFTLGTMTSGSVLFAGSSGAISQNNAAFFWDDTKKALAIGTARDIAAQGDFVAGLTGGTRMFWDTGNVNLSLFGTAPVFVLGDTGAGRASIRFNRSSVVKSIIGLAGSANDLVPGTAAGDLVIRSETVPLWFTLDGGTTVHGYFSTAGAFRVANGTVAAPPFAFVNFTGTGFVPATGSHGGISVCETTGAAAFIRLNEGSQASWGLVVAATSHIGWNSTTIGLGNLTPDTLLFREAAGTLAQRNGNNAQEHRIYAGNGSYVGNLKCVNESLTIAAAASTDSATSIPAGSVIVAVAVRVTTVIPTAATFTVTTASGGTTMNTAAVSTAAGTTDKGTAGGVFYQATATAVRITPNAVPAAGTGVVRLAIYYYDVVAPTS